MKHQGYTIRAIKEKTLNQQLEAVPVTSYEVHFEGKIVETGLPSQESAKAAIDRRRRLRQRVGLDPAG